MFTAETIHEEIEEATPAIEQRLSSDPRISEKFERAWPELREGWVAWTWFYDRLVERGLTPSAAIALRATIIRDASTMGTYCAMASCLNNDVLLAMVG